MCVCVCVRERLIEGVNVVSDALVSHLQVFARGCVGVGLCVGVCACVRACVCVCACVCV